MLNESESLIFEESIHIHVLYWHTQFNKNGSTITMGNPYFYM